MHYALDYYVKTAPSYQTATSIFKDEWISIFPAEYQVDGGFAPYLKMIVPSGRLISWEE
ncbi:hypothetical protein ACLMAB_28640 [Brevibacillus laterosporus]